MRFLSSVVRSLSGNQLASASCCRSRWWCHPPVPRGAPVGHGGHDRGVVKAWRQTSAEGNGVRASLPRQPWGSGHEELVVPGEDGVVRRRPQTREHIPHRHQRHGCGRRDVQMLHPKAAWQHQIFSCPPYYWWVEVMRWFLILVFEIIFFPLSVLSDQTSKLKPSKTVTSETRLFPEATGQNELNGEEKPFSWINPSVWIVFIATRDVAVHLNHGSLRISRHRKKTM